MKDGLIHIKILLNKIIFEYNLILKGIKNFIMNEIKYISDTHFGHFNCIRYDNRPWSTVEEMEEAMIKRWNRVVDPTDMVYILGDVVWSNKYEEWVRILSQLNGCKFIIKGNHDKTEILNKLLDEKISVEDLPDKKLIEGWSHQEVIQDNGRYVVLNHSPMPFFVNMHHDNTYHLYGHVHISFDAQIIKHVRSQTEALYQHPIRMYNCGCMIPGMDYCPRTLDEIIAFDTFNRKMENDPEAYMKMEVEMGHDKARIAK